MPSTSHDNKKQENPKQENPNLEEEKEEKRKEPRKSIPNFSEKCQEKPEKFEVQASPQKRQLLRTKNLVKMFENRKKTDSDDITGDKFKILGGKLSQPMRCTVTLGRELELDVTKIKEKMHHSDWRKLKKFEQPSE